MMRRTVRTSNDPGRRARAACALTLSLVGLATTAPIAAAAEALKIDLGTALRLADERNLDVAIYYERVTAASSQLAQARLLAVPTIRVGSAYDRHHGTIQETSGAIDDVDRVSQFTGATASLGVDVANAVFAPLAARQNLEAVRAERRRKPPPGARRRRSWLPTTATGPSRGAGRRRRARTRKGSRRPHWRATRRPAKAWSQTRRWPPCSSSLGSSGRSRFARTSRPPPRTSCACCTSTPT